jgi:hypothetical protein
MIVYGCAIGDATVATTTTTNLYLGMLDRIGVRAQHIGDSTDKLDVV